MATPTLGAKTPAESYIHAVFEQLMAKNQQQPEFLQAVEEIFISLVPVFEQHPEYIHHNILSRIVEPDRIISFRVTWQDDGLHALVGFKIERPFFV